jgi:hypothetical protein
VNPRAVLDDVKRRNFLTLPGLELRPLRHPARSQSRIMDTEPVSPAVKRPGHETGNPPPSSAEVKNGGAIPPLLMSSWRGVPLI